MQSDKECQQWNRFCIGIDYLFIYDSLRFFFCTSFWNFSSQLVCRCKPGCKTKFVECLLFTIHFYVSISFIPDWLLGWFLLFRCLRQACFVFSITLMHVFFSFFCCCCWRGWKYFVTSFRLYSLCLFRRALVLGRVFHINLFYYFYIIVMDTSRAQSQ